MFNRRMWMTQASGKIARNIPLNVPLIPELTGRVSEYGTVTGKTETNSQYNVRAIPSYDVAYSNITNEPHALFKYNKTPAVWGRDTYHAREITFEFSSNFYKGWLPDGYYNFTGKVDSDASTIMTCGFIYVLGLDNVWYKVYDIPYDYGNRPKTINCVTNVSIPFKGVRTYHTNPNNYDHTRYYYIWGYNIIKLA